MMRGDLLFSYAASEYPFPEIGYSKIELENAFPPNCSRTWNLFVVSGLDDSGKRSYVVCKLPRFVLICAVSAVAPWFRLNRFSLRTLLIATTLVAVVLGLVVCAL